jgi:hypothetical protein
LVVASLLAEIFQNRRHQPTPDSELSCQAADSADLPVSRIRRQGFFSAILLLESTCAFSGVSHVDSHAAGSGSRCGGDFLVGSDVLV